MLLDAVEQELAEFQGVPVHKQLAAPLAALVAEAKRAGHDMAIASGFRSIDRQCQIWNGKALGRRPVLNDQGEPMDVSKLAPEALMFAILRWSALPGASRHHWGTDVDVFERGALPAGEPLQLTIAECEGPFASFYHWLDAWLAQPHVSFFRPYASPSGGVAPEPWHLSFAPAASRFQTALDKESLFELVMSLDIELKDPVARHFDEIYERFVVTPPPPFPLPGTDRQC